MFTKCILTLQKVNIIYDKMTNRYNNPKEAICALLIEKKLSVDEIILKLYKKEKNSRVHTWLQEMLRDKWVEFHSEFRKDGRIKYYAIKPNAIISSISKDLNLTPIMKKRLF